MLREVVNLKNLIFNSITCKLVIRIKLVKNKKLIKKFVFIVLKHQNFTNYSKLI